MPIASRAMLWIALVLALALAAGCQDREAEALMRVKDRVCACKDVACAETAIKDVPQDDVKSRHRSQVIAQDMLDCLAKLYADRDGVH